MHNKKLLTSYFLQVPKKPRVESVDGGNTNADETLPQQHQQRPYLAVDSPSTSKVQVETENHPYDISHAVGQILDDYKIQHFLKETWKPTRDYAFPAQKEGKQTRKFQYDWLNTINWLAYSEDKCGCFCKYCVLFAPSGGGTGSQDLNKFVKTPLIKYKKATEEFKKHADNDYHKFSVQRGLEFLKVMESGNKESVSVLLDKKIEVIIESNKKRLRPIIKTVIFCARNNLPLRGHRDDGPINYESYQEQVLSGKQGIFRSLLGFRLDAGDEDLKYHLENSVANCTMISKTVQNEIIESIGAVVQNDLISQVKRSTFFSILCDETTDVSTKEQMSLCIRYVDLQYMMIKEEFIGFVELDGTTGLEIKQTIVKELNKLGLSLTNLRGQGYDGGSNMSGKFIGVQALLLQEQPLAFYTHCFSHQLNLCLTKSCDIQPIKNMMGIVGSVSNFIKGSAKRMSAFEMIISKANLEGTKKTRLKTLCPTRWVERHDSVLVFKELLVHVAEFLEETESDKDGETSSKAVALGSALKRSDFLISLEVSVTCLALTLKLSKYLQDPTQDLSTAKSYIASIISRLKSMRSKADDEFGTIFNSAVNTASLLGAEISLPRTCSRQTQRTNVPTSSAEHYFKIGIFLPFLDHLISQLEIRFCENVLKITPLEGLIPTNFEKFQEVDVMKAAHTYSTDVLASAPELAAEMSLWREHWRATPATELPKNCVETLCKCNRSFFPNVAILLQIYATLPVTTATTERSFSTLKRVKTYLRSTMVEERLNGLALANVHKEKSIDVEEVLKHFALTKSRRMKLSNWDEKGGEQ